MITFEDTELFGSNFYPFSFQLLAKGCMEVVCVSCEQKNTLIKKFVCGDFSKIGCVKMAGKKINWLTRKSYVQKMAWLTGGVENYPDDRLVKEILSAYANDKAEFLVPMMAAYWGLAQLLTVSWGALNDKQRKQVTLARIMCIESPLVVLDDVFLDLDGQDKERMIKLIAVMCDNGSTVVLLHNQGQQMIPFSSMVDVNDYNKSVSL